MTHAANWTNPKTIDATGYMPYMLRRQKIAQQTSKSHTFPKQYANMNQYFANQRLHQGYIDCVHNHAKDLFRSQWECSNDKKGLYSRAQFEMDKVLEEKKLDLRKRQERLKGLLDAEKSMFDAEIKSMTEPAVMTREGMLERYSEIMTQKEMERRKVVEAKRDQQFKNNCAELRPILSRKISKLISEEGKTISEERNRFLEEKLQDEQMFADAWFLDSEAKRLRESEQARLKKESDIRFGKHFLEQFQPDPQRQSRGSHEDEAQLVIEQQRLLSLEEEWEREEKKLKQERVKKQLDKCLKEKLRRKAKEVQEDLMLDLYFLDKILTDSDEDQKKEQKKQALKKEQDDYLAYLAAQIKKEGEFERQIEQLQGEETEKMWQRREKEWERERKRREDLNKKNMRQLYEQIRNKMEKCRLVQDMKMKYDEEIKKQAEFDQRNIEENKILVRQENIRNQKELVHQIRQKEAYSWELRRKEQEELQRIKDLQEEYDTKMNQIIADAKIPNLHPFRS